jgi:hypothetical protein
VREQRERSMSGSRKKKPRINTDETRIRNATGQRSKAENSNGCLLSDL